MLTSWACVNVVRAADRADWLGNTLMLSRLWVDYHTTRKETGRSSTVHLSVSRSRAASLCTFRHLNAVWKRCVCPYPKAVFAPLDTRLCVYVFLPEGSVVQRRVSVFILDLDGAVGLQQSLHHLHVALVSSHLQCSLTLVLYIHLTGAQTRVEIH